MATWTRTRKFPTAEWTCWMAAGRRTSTATSTWKVSSFTRVHAGDMYTWTQRVGLFHLFYPLYIFCDGVCGRVPSSPDVPWIIINEKTSALLSFPWLSLLLTGGLMIPWRRRWCVLKDETFMWFRAKQDSVKSGWLYKKGGGMSTLSRRNWKMRWFVLRESKLMYFENDSEEKLKGTIDVRTAK